jgi:hypothetical protein
MRYWALTFTFVRNLGGFSPANLAHLKANFQNTYLGAILIAVAFINAGIDFYQIQKSEAILASFLALIPPSCRVVRDGAIATIPASDLVKGDLVLLVGFFPSGRDLSHNPYSGAVTKHLQISSYFHPRTLKLTIAV